MMKIVSTLKIFVRQVRTLIIHGGASPGKSPGRWETMAGGRQTDTPCTKSLGIKFILWVLGRV